MLEMLCNENDNLTSNECCIKGIFENQFEKSTGAGLMNWSIWDQILRKTTISDKDLVTNSYLREKEWHFGQTKTPVGLSLLPFFFTP